MNCELGKQIKNLRINKGATQEDLANYLGVSFQAVSKWENDVAMPDITLLPKLSVYFGVTIDELFRISQEEEFERIGNMINNEREICDEDFKKTESYLQNIIKEDCKNSEALCLLSELYNHRANYAHTIAAEYAKRGLMYAPNCKNLHVNLIESLGGYVGDGYIDNHRETINYYTNFVAYNPNYLKGYIILIDNLLADNRFDEAKVAIDKARKVQDEYCFYVFEGDIELGKGNKDKAIKIWNEVVEKYPNIWQTYCCRADRFLKLGMIDKAIEDYHKCFDVQPKGKRLTDGLLSLAQIYEDIKRYDKAIEMWEKLIEVLREDYGLTTGEQVEQPKRDIERLRRLMK